MPAANEYYASNRLARAMVFMLEPSSVKQNVFPEGYHKNGFLLVSTSSGNLANTSTYKQAEAMLSCVVLCNDYGNCMVASYELRLFRKAKHPRTEACISPHVLQL